MLALPKAQQVDIFQILLQVWLFIANVLICLAVARGVRIEVLGGHPLGAVGLPDDPLLLPELSLGV